VVLEFELKAFTLSHSTIPIFVKVFWDRVSWTTCLGWLQTMILLISASWVARITGVSHQRPATSLNPYSVHSYVLDTSFFLKMFCVFIYFFYWPFPLTVLARCSHALFLSVSPEMLHIFPHILVYRIPRNWNFIPSKLRISWGNAAAVFLQLGILATTTRGHCSWDI
jgi:hypothetical protein